MSRRAVVAIVASVVLGATGMSIASPPPVRAAGDLAGDPAVITLGDSYISGEGGRWQGNGNTEWPGSRYGTDRAAHDCNASETWCYHDPTRVYGNSYNDECDRSVTGEVSYVEHVVIGDSVYAIDPANRLNVACSGATSQDVVSNTFKGEAPQVDQLATWARARSIKAVVLSIGGNDIGFGAIVTSCVTAFTTGGAHCNATYGPEIPSLVTTLRTAATTSVDAIRNTMSAAGYADSDYRLILQTYPAPLPSAADNRYSESGWTRWTEGGCPFYNDDSDWAIGTVVPAIDDALKDVAAGTGAEYLDLRTALHGHEVCAKGAQQATSGDNLRNPIPRDRAEWVRWIGIPHFSQGDVREYLHPSYYGQQVMGGCLNGLLAGTEMRPTCDAG